MEKKTLAIITCDRPDFFHQVVTAIPKDIDILVVNDGKTFDGLEYYPHIQNKKRMGVAACKNMALKYFYERGVEHLFLLEDDICILDSGVFQKYIDAAKKNQLKHLNFGLSSRKNPILDQNIDLTFYRNPYAGFSYFHRDVIEKVGYFDEGFYNALEHIDYTLRIAIHNMHPFPPLYPDIRNSHWYLTNVEEGFKGSIIRKDYSLFKAWMEKAVKKFIQKWEVHPAKLASVNWIEFTSKSMLHCGAVKKT